MADSKFSKNLIKLRCTNKSEEGKLCNRTNYYTRKNKKLVERKIETKKFCKGCQNRTIHKEARK